MHFWCKKLKWQISMISLCVSKYWFEVLSKLGRGWSDSGGRNGTRPPFEASEGGSLVTLWSSAPWVSGIRDQRSRKAEKQKIRNQRSRKADSGHSNTPLRALRGTVADFSTKNWPCLSKNWILCRKLDLFGDFFKAIFDAKNYSDKVPWFTGVFVHVEQIEPWVVGRSGMQWDATPLWAIGGVVPSRNQKFRALSLRNQNSEKQKSTCPAF